MKLPDASQSLAVPRRDFIPNDPDILPRLIALAVEPLRDAHALVERGRTVNPWRLIAALWRSAVPIAPDLHRFAVAKPLGTINVPTPGNIYIYISCIGP